MIADDPNQDVDIWNVFAYFSKEKGQVQDSEPNGLQSN